MAFTLSRNLKLRIDSNLTANSKYNLEKIDTLGSTFLVDTTDTLNIRSRTDILIEPESADLGGASSGGTVSIGTASHLLTEVDVFASAFHLSSPIALLDQATGGTKYLQLRYKSDLSGSADTIFDRTLSMDLEGADRFFVLGGNYSQIGGSLALTLGGTTTLTLPLTGTVATLAGSETFTNKTINASSNSLLNIANASISATAAIAYSKLNLTGSLVNADVASGANIAYTKLALSNSIQNSDVNVAAAIARSKLANGTANYIVINSSGGVMTEEPYLSRARGGAGQDQSSVTYPSSGVLVTETGTETLTNKSINGSQNVLTNVPFSALNLTNSILNSDINASAAIAYSKLNLTGSIVDADVAALAGITRTKIANGTANHVLINSGTGAFSSEAQLAITRGGSGAATANTALNNFLPTQTGNNGKVLQTDGSNSSWVATGTGSVTSVALTVPSGFSVSGSPITTNGTLAVTADSQTSNKFYASSGTVGVGAVPSFRQINTDDLPFGIPYAQLDLSNDIVNSDVYIHAAIAYSKLAALTASKALQSDSSGFVSASAVSSTELGYVSGVTSALQTQLDNKQPLDGDLTALAALSTTGIIVRSASNTAITRALLAGTGLTISNGDGVSAAPSYSITNTSVTAASYGSASAVGTFTVNAQGQLTAAATTSISITASQVSDFTTASQTVINAYATATTWSSGDGTSKSITHSLATNFVTVNVYEIDTGLELLVDSIQRTDTNNVTLTSSSAPTGSGWKVIIRK